MKIVGRRFWTWMSLWALAFFVKGDLTAGPQEKGTGQVTDGTSNTRHKVPLLKTQSSKTGVFPKTQSNFKTPSGLKTQSGFKSQSGLKTESIPGVGKVAKLQSSKVRQTDKTSSPSRTEFKTQTHKVHK